MRSKVEVVADPTVEQKQETIGRVSHSIKAFMILPVAVEVVPLQMVRPYSSLEKKPTTQKRKLIIEEDSQSEDVAALRKLSKASSKPTPVPTSTPTTIATPIEKTAKLGKASDDDSLSLEDIFDESSRRRPSSLCDV
ncbi:hypothetical protein F511_35755 [Dorcoceras hygrometricum]|uniref:Uncharacterized protein n=1 Tax=Dorcoceras hygrometricum TaxID=472368 RepID=A0A2Z7ATE6_9LAMI|nr:hypothetical protein F511_35755 [Dorcoceras hygrometricum]